MHQEAPDEHFFVTHDRRKLYVRVADHEIIVCERISDTLSYTLMQVPQEEWLK